jgi:hypothetical protein
MKRSFIVTGAVMLVTAALLEEQSRSPQPPTMVAVGEAEREVIAKMGRPHQVSRRLWLLWPTDSGMAREYVYFPPWTIADEAWAISLNANGVVIHTAHFVSP